MSYEDKFDEYELNMSIINDHREAWGLLPFDNLSEEEIEKNLILINDNAPYGNSPWPYETDF